MIEKDDIDEIKSKKDKLQEKLMELGAKMYEGINKDSGENTSSDDNEDDSKDSKKDDVKDADYEEK